MRVEQLMMTNVHCCRPEDTLDHAAQLMWDYDCGCLPVCSGDGSMMTVGMITDRDIAMCALFQSKPLHELCVSNAMAHEVRTCHAQDSLADVENIMREGKIRRLPVVDAEGCLIGMISLADLAQEAARERGARTQEITETEVGDTLAAICKPSGARLAA